MAVGRVNGEKSWSSGLVDAAQAAALREASGGARAGAGTGRWTGVWDRRRD